MNKRKLLYIVISIICVIAIIVAVYYQIFKKAPNNNITNNEQIEDEIQGEEKQDLEEIKAEFNLLFDNTFYDQGYDITSIQKIIGLEDKDVIYAANTIKDKKEGKYEVDINLPVFNVQSEASREFNNTTQAIFADKASQILLNSEKYTIYGMDYVAYMNENILSLIIRSTLKEGNNPQRVIVQTYNYDIITGKKVSLNEVLESRQINLEEVNEKIEETIKEANKQAEALSNALGDNGQSIYIRDLNNAMYVTDNVNYFFLGENGQIYILYPYGNANFTSEIDIIKI